MTHEALKDALEKALQLFLKHDRHLIDVRSSERSVCHRVALHLANILASKEYDVDCEYNRNGNIPKRLIAISTNGNDCVYPDIIVHKRGTSKNLLVIEAKYENEDHGRDEEKIKSYLEEMNYRHGVILKIPSSENHTFDTQWWYKDNHKNAVPRPKVTSRKVDISLQSAEKLVTTLKNMNLKPERKISRKGVRKLLEKIGKS